jgi:mannan endo-1,4-beta-mannosidase
MRILAYFIFAVLSLNSCKNLNQAVNPNASNEAKELLQYIYDLKGKNILSGQHNYGHELLRSTDTIISYTGKTPAIWGSDLLGWDHGNSNTRQNVIDEAILQYSKGSIITLMYHQVKPFDHDSLGFARSVKGRVSDEQWEQILTPGSEYNILLLEKLDNIAGYLKQLQVANIPVLWRPYHEMNGVWFWYGNRPGPDGYAKLWKIMYSRFVDYHKLNNLIWVWNANAPRDWKDDVAYDYHLFYPGDKYVDILAADIYKGDYKQSHHDDLLKLANGKPIAIGECGKIPTPQILTNQLQWSWFMIWARFPWTNNKPEEVKALYNDPIVLTRDEIEISK